MIIKSKLNKLKGGSSYDKPEEPLHKYIQWAQDATAALDKVTKIVEKVNALNSIIISTRDHAKQLTEEANNNTSPNKSQEIQLAFNKVDKDINNIDDYINQIENAHTEAETICHNIHQPKHPDAQKSIEQFDIIYNAEQKIRNMAIHIYRTLEHIKYIFTPIKEYINTTRAAIYPPVGTHTGNPPMPPPAERPAELPSDLFSTISLDKGTGKGYTSQPYSTIGKDDLVILPQPNSSTKFKRSATMPLNSESLSQNTKPRTQRTMSLLSLDQHASNPSTANYTKTNIEKVNDAVEEVDTAANNAELAAAEVNSAVEKVKSTLDNLDSAIQNNNYEQANNYAEMIKQQWEITNNEVQRALDSLKQTDSQFQIIKNIYDLILGKSKSTSLDTDDISMSQKGGASKTDWSEIDEKYKSAKEAVEKAYESYNSAEKAVKEAEEYYTKIQDNINKLKQQDPTTILLALPPLPPPAHPPPLSSIVSQQDSSEIDSSLSEIPEFNDHLIQLVNALGLQEESKFKLITKLKRFNNKNQYKLINITKDIIKDLVIADEEIKKFTKDNTNLDMIELNNQLAELQILALLQKTNNSKQFTDEFVNLLKDKMNTVNEMLTHNLLDNDTTQQGGSSKNIYMNKYIKYKNKYLSLKKIKYNLNN